MSYHQHRVHFHQRVSMCTEWIIKAVINHPAGFWKPTSIAACLAMRAFSSLDLFLSPSFRSSASVSFCCCWSNSSLSLLFWFKILLISSSPSFCLLFDNCTIPPLNFTSCLVYGLYIRLSDRVCRRWGNLVPSWGPKPISWVIFTRSRKC